MQGYKTHVQSGILLNANEASQNVNEIQLATNYIVYMQRL